MTDDTIYRQAAIDAVAELASSMSVCISVDECHGMKRMQGMAVRALDDLPSAQPEIIRCKDCKHFHYDMPYVIQGVPVLGHEVCDFWGDGCKTSENGFCSYAERSEDAH